MFTLRKALGLTIFFIVFLYRVLCSVFALAIQTIFGVGLRPHTISAQWYIEQGIIPRNSKIRSFNRVPLNSGVKGLSAYVVEKCEMEIEDSSGKRRREQFAVKRPALLGDKGVKVATLIMAHGPIYYVAKHEKCALTEVIPHVSTKIAPRVVHVYHNSWTNQCVFTMELIRPVKGTENPRNWSSQMALSILEKVAQLHVTYMGDSLKRLKKVGLDDAELITRNLVYIARTLCRQPGWKEYYARLRAPAQQVCDIVLDKGELIEDYRIQHTDPRYDTVIHGDFHAQNIIFDGSNGGCDPLLIDWQSCAIGTCFLDIAYFMIGTLPFVLPPNLSQDERMKRRQEALCRYLKILNDAGVNIDYESAVLYVKMAILSRTITLLIMAVSHAHKSVGSDGSELFGEPNCLSDLVDDYNLLELAKQMASC